MITSLENSLLPPSSGSGKLSGLFGKGDKGGFLENCPLAHVFKRGFGNDILFSTQESFQILDA
jgi:hypothetical protein